MDIAIVGLGCRFPSARDPVALWELVRGGGVVFRPVPESRWNHAAFLDPSGRNVDKAYIANGAYLEDEELREFGALHYAIPPRRVQVTDPQQRLLIDVTRCALADAGLEAAGSSAASSFPGAGRWDRKRTGVFVGVSVSEWKELGAARTRTMQLLEGQFGRTLALSPEQKGELWSALVEDAPPMRAFSIAGSLLNMNSAVIAQQWDLGGPALSIDTACSSSLVAAQQAVVNLRGGLIDTAIVGGVYLNLLPDNLIGFSRIGAISRTGVCRPFDAQADGFVMGEGAAALVFKRLPDAQRDGDRVYAVIRGVGCNNDGRGDGPMTPRQEGQLESLRMAYADAGFPATTLGYIEAHGTATTVGDVVEVGAFRQLFEEQGWTGAQGARCGIGSIKANLGHTMSAAGVAGLVKAVLALHTKTLPPQPALGEENPKLSLAAEGGAEGPFFLSRSSRPWVRGEHPRRAAVSSFGFGGTNAHLVLEEAPRVGESVGVSVGMGVGVRVGAGAAADLVAGADPVADAVAAALPALPRAELLLLSGSRASVLARAARELGAALPILEREGSSLADVALTLAARAKDDGRLAIVAASFAQAAERLAIAAKALEERAGAERSAAGPNGDLPAPSKTPPLQLAPGVLFAQGPRTGAERAVALLFPGQGAQRVGLLREFDRAFPVFRERLDALDAALGPELHRKLGGTLRSFLYPELPLGPDGESEPLALLEAERRLTATQVCQPAMAAVGLALHALLESCGVVAQATLGHSLGEFVAASAAGRLTPEECVRLVARRGLAMVALPLADRGAMASCAADLATVSAALARLPPEHQPAGAQPVVAANLNQPRQTVISGHGAGIARARALLEAQGVQSTLLEVSHAFHSPLVAGAAVEMAALLEELPLPAGRIPVVSGITAAPLPAQPERVREIWVRHTTAPVDFLGALQTAAAPAPAGVGARIFLQVGAGGVLTSFAKASLAERDRLATASLAGRDDDGLATFASALGLLFCAGVDLDLSPLFAGRGARLALAPPAPLETQPYWVLERRSKKQEPFRLSVAGGGTAGVVQPAGASPQALPDAARAGGLQLQGDGKMDGLVALFREQVALLQAQSLVLQRQAEALAAHGVGGQAAAGPGLPPAAGWALPVASAPLLGAPNGSREAAAQAGPAGFASTGPASPSSTETKAPAASPAAAKAAVQVAAEGEALRADVTRVVLDSVARISAFPVGSLQTTQTLAGDLGFDSLMTVELDGDVQKAFPTSGGLPRSLLGMGTTVQALIDHVVAALGAPARSETALSAALGDVAAAGPALVPYLPRAVDAPLAGGSDDQLPAALLVTRDPLGVADALAEKLASLGRRVVLVDLGGPVDAALEPVPDGAHRWTCRFDGPDAAPLFAAAARVAGPIGGVLHLAPLGDSSSLADALAPGAPFDLARSAQHLVWALRLARGQAKAGADASGGLFLAATRGGLAPQTDGPGVLTGGLLGGFARSLARERTDEIVRRVDLFEEAELTGTTRSAFADGLATLLLEELRSGDAGGDVAWSRGERVQLELAPVEGATPLALAAADVVLVTGGARGVGLKLAGELARSGAAFLVTGRSMASAETEAALVLLRSRGARQALYLRWDAGEAAPDTLAQVRAALGPFTVWLHAAGIAEDAQAANKDDAQLLRVLQPKLGGLVQVLRACASDPLRLALFTASWSGHFGNAGQTDYAAANAVLDGAARLLGSVRPGLVALSLGLPPWDGTTLASRIPGFARAALAEQGVPFLDDTAGAQALQSVLALGRPGALLLAPKRPERRLVRQWSSLIDRRDHLYLEDHQLAGQPVLPLASALDLICAAADEVATPSAPLIVRDLSLRQPIRIGEATLLTLRAASQKPDGGELSVSLSASVPGGVRPFSRAPAYTGFLTPDADVGPALTSAVPAPPATGRPELPLPLADFYGTTTFHGPRMQGIVSIESISPAGIVGLVRTSRPADMMKSPHRDRWAVDPLALDGAFQLAGYWAWTQLQRAGFPIGVEEYAQRGPLPEGPLRATLTLEQSQGDIVRGTIVLQAPSGEVVAVARGVQGEFKHRDPRFLRARGLAVVRPVQEKDDGEGATAGGSESAGGREGVRAGPGEGGSASGGGGGGGAAPVAPFDLATVPEENYKVELFSEVQELEQRLGLAAAFGLKNPYFNVHERVTNDTSVIGGRVMINWSSYNYLGLSGDPDVSAAAQAAIEQFGTSVSASRVASGEKPLHRELEQELARFLGTEDSIVMVSGHGVFVTTIGHLVGDGDLILHDALAHDCILGGAKLSGAKRRPFPHGDVAALEKALQQLRPHYKRVLIAVEGVYSMDGDICPLPEYIRLKKQYGALLLVDEAHSIGVLGATGRGVGEQFGVNRADVDLWMGTMSKSLASCGGYVAGSKALVQYLKYTAPGFIFSVGISPANAAAGLEALRQIDAHPEKVERLHERARLFVQLAKAKGIDTGLSAGSAVVPAIVGNSLHSLQLSEALRQRGINVQPILYPAVEESAARLRFFVTSTHTEQQIRETVEVLAEELERVRADSGDLAANV